MGVNLCGLRNRAVPNTASSKKDRENENCGGLTASVMKFLKPRSRRAHRHEKQEVREPYNKTNTSELLTLEDWFMSSPGLNVNGGDILLVPRQSSSSRRIHPSFSGDLEEELLANSVEGCSLQERSPSRKTEENEYGQSRNSSFCRTKSGKMEKKVSFRSPEVADVFVVEYSPDRIHVKSNG